MNRTVLSVITSLLLSGASAACGNEQGRTVHREATTPPGLTVEEVYASVARAIGGGEGDVLHVAMVVEGGTLNSGTPVPIPEAFKDYKPEDYADQLWLEPATDSVRTEHRTRYEGETSNRVDRGIQRAARLFSVDHIGNSAEYTASTCPESASTVVVVLMGCTGSDSTTTVEQDEHEGKPAILLIARRESESDGSTIYFERTVFVDPTTHLPLGDERKSSHDDPTLERYDFSTVRRYDIEFVRRSSLADGFFEPAAIGYVATEPIPADNLRSDINGMRVYWIGADFDAGLEGPLVLLRVAVYPGEFSPGPRATLRYTIVGDRILYRGVGIRNYPIDGGDQVEAHILGEWNKPDTVREDVPIQGRRAELRRMSNTRYGELYMIRIYFETTIVVVSDYLGAPPYTGRDAILRIAAALRPYEK